MEQKPTTQPTTQTTQEDVSALKQKLKHSRIENQIITQLAKNAATDIETAALVAKARLKSAASSDVRQIVQAIKDEKPFLFAQNISKPTRTQPLKVSDQAQSNLDKTAASAAKTGTRRDVLEYLRAKRLPR